MRDAGAEHGRPRRAAARARSADRDPAEPGRRAAAARRRGSPGSPQPADHPAGDQPADHGADALHGSAAGRRRWAACGGRRPRPRRRADSEKPITSSAQPQRDRGVQQQRGAPDEARARRQLDRASGWARRRRPAARLRHAQRRDRRPPRAGRWPRRRIATAPPPTSANSVAPSSGPTSRSASRVMLSEAFDVDEHLLGQHVLEQAVERGRYHDEGDAVAERHGVHDPDVARRRAPAAAAASSAAEATFAHDQEGAPRHPVDDVPEQRRQQRRRRHRTGR